ncbi:MAG: phage holin family protein [Oscillospiraceae bacterium]|nr:phage holin family protein [Oscillospiraceae bacterium]
MRHIQDSLAHGQNADRTSSYARHVEYSHIHGRYGDKFGGAAYVLDCRSTVGCCRQQVSHQHNLLKKMLYFAIVAVAHIVDKATNLGGSLRTLVIAFLVANEGISILENCGRSGLPIPKRLMDVLEQIWEKEE